MGTYLLKGEVGMGVACVIFILSLRKGGDIGHLKWYSMRKPPTAWANIYGAGLIKMRDTIFSQDGKKFTDTACPTRGTWFGKFM